MENNKYNDYISYFRKVLPLGQCFDLIERNLVIGGKEAYLYFIDGFMSSDVLERVISGLLLVSKHDMGQCSSAEDFIKHHLSHGPASTEKNTDTMMKSMLSGLTVMLIDGFADAIIMDLRTYPARSVEEPEKEKSLRGPKDGFVEVLLKNIAMIRRRIRDPRLIFEKYTVGSISKTDVCIGYMKGIVREETLETIRQKITDIKRDTLTVGDQSLVEALGKSQWLSPFPKVRYSQRPDVISAHLTEGKLVILVDNSPTAILVPTGIFDFFQDTDDYYFPLITGNYFRLLRILNMISVIFLTPVYLLLAEGFLPVHPRLEFFIPDEGYAIPLFVQFILLEFAIDALKLASLNTPSSLGMSLSVIGALIMGQFAVDSGWFIPQTILCMAVLALASFTQPSIELGYATKYMRVLLLIGVAIGGLWGALIALLINIIILIRTKNIVGTSYLYPLIPLNKEVLKRLVFRTKA
ncbi:MAG: spore germination protein [Bacillota bacterium]|jgi:stage V sporulation protein AF|nr:spore germination protein [Bacillota bacterium]